MIFKVLILGDSGTGKTSLRNQFFFGSFTLSYTSTIGANFLTKQIAVADQPAVSLCVWDTAGQERFNALSPTYFRGTDCCVLLHDLTRPQTLRSLRTHFEGVKKVCGRVGVVIIVGNKLDAAPEHGKREEEDIRKWVLEELGEYEDILECSAKSGARVSELFELIAKRCSERAKAQQRIEAFEVDESNVVGRTNSNIDLRRRGSTAKTGNGCTC